MKFIKNLLSDLSYILGTMLGIGFIPIASGTFASIATALVWFIIPDHFFYNTIENEIFYDNYLLFMIALMLFSWLSVYICTECEKKLGHDASSIVIDEFCGYLFAVLFLPKTIMVALYALILFRIFDIMKPLFINKAQKLPAGWGIMLDDVLAGICSNLVLQIIYLIYKFHPIPKGSIAM